MNQNLNPLGKKEIHHSNTSPLKNLTFLYKINEPILYPNENENKSLSPKEEKE